MAISESAKGSLINNINAMVETDQIAASHWEQEWAAYKDSVYSAHQSQASEIFEKYGFPGFDLVGEEASNNYWLIVQHCDKFPDFQRQVLADMNNEVKKGNANPNNYAYLYDRVAVNSGQKQMFGTQVDYAINTTGRAFPKIGLLDSIQVDQLRSDYQLVPLKEYLNQMTIMHYQLNEERYREMGILEPDMYND